MNITNIVSSPLLEDDTHLYPNNKTVVRIFKKGKWIVGKLHRISPPKPDQPDCKIRLNPMVGFQPFVANPNPMNPNDALLCVGDKAIPGSYQSTDLPQAFILKESEKIAFDELPPKIMVIRFADGVAILSTRNTDMISLDIFMSEIPK